MSKTWRQRCKPLIAQIIKEFEGKPEKDLRKALRDGYPWGQRAMHPYKIWCDEVRVQTGRKKNKIKGIPNNPNQLQLI